MSTFGRPLEDLITELAEGIGAVSRNARDKRGASCL
jgi:hypothetical protein